MEQLRQRIAEENIMKSNIDKKFSVHYDAVEAELKSSTVAGGVEGSDDSAGDGSGGTRGLDLAAEAAPRAEGHAPPSLGCLLTALPHYLHCLTLAL
ncbi:uncharacterized protein FYN16_006223 isoform 1-T1 [Cariama cristata]